MFFSENVKKSKNRDLYNFNCYLYKNIARFWNYVQISQSKCGTNHTFLQIAFTFFNFFKLFVKRLNVCTCHGNIFSWTSLQNRDSNFQIASNIACYPQMISRLQDWFKQQTFSRKNTSQLKTSAWSRIKISSWESFLSKKIWRPRFRNPLFTKWKSRVSQVKTCNNMRIREVLMAW